jgi:hypothetical protein
MQTVPGCHPSGRGSEFSATARGLWPLLDSLPASLSKPIKAVAQNSSRFYAVLPPTWNDLRSPFTNQPDTKKELS